MKNKWLIAPIGCLCLMWFRVANAEEGNVIIDITAKCAIFTDCCKGIHFVDGELTCDLMCTDGQKCTPAGCCDDGSVVYTDAGGTKRCCMGEVKWRSSDGVQVCCTIPEECPEGQELVTNYIDEIGACGKTCCTKKADEGDSTNYKLAGAVNGSCCGTYQSSSSSNIECDSTGSCLGNSFSSTNTVSVRINGGVPYCAISNTNTISNPDGSVAGVYSSTYVSDDKFCDVSKGGDGDVWSNDCYCSSRGDPMYGEEPCP
ncbi:MAG: hypothetical protein J6U64_03720 [Alphaproteobacteria bacterium]|nr:hypothetical protein [Alphaproteobacteria bacterium]